MRSTIGWPPSSVMPASNETRVRVDGLWKISATVAPRSTSRASGAALSSSARSISASSSSRLSSAPVRKWRGKRCSVRWPHGARAHLEPLPRPRGAAGRPRPVRRVRGGAGWLGLGRRAAAGGAAVVAAALGASSASSARRVLTSRNALLAVRQARRRAAGRTLIKSNGGGCNAILVRARAGSSSTACGAWPAGPSGAGCTPCGCACGVWVANAARHRATTPCAARRCAGRRDACAGGRARSAAGPRRRLQRPGLALDGSPTPGGHDVDHVFLGGGLASTAAPTLERGPLSDHAPRPRRGQPLRQLTRVGAHSSTISAGAVRGRAAVERRLGVVLDRRAGSPGRRARRRSARPASAPCRSRTTRRRR